MSKGMEKRYEYLFLDMEWNQKAGTMDLANREPIQIGIIGTDKDLEQQKLFSKGIRVEDVSTLTEATCKLTHTAKDTVKLAKSEKEVLLKAMQTFPAYRYVVVWTKDTYNLFRAGMERAEISMPRHKVVVLQDVLRMITMKDREAMSFEKALEKAGIPYEPSWLHYSKHDVKYLYKLFKTMYEKYGELTDREFCAVTQRTRIIHAPDCRYVKPGQTELVTNAKRLLFSGYRHCVCCGTDGMWRRFRWDKKTKKSCKTGLKKPPMGVPVEKRTSNVTRNTLTEDDIERICEQFEMTCNIISNVVFLTTPMGYWRVYLHDGKVKQVLHANYRIGGGVRGKSEFYNRKKKCNQGFHRQNIATDNFYEVAKYIYYHDKNRLKVKRDRLDMLFEKIEKERSDRYGL